MASLGAVITRYTSRASRRAVSEDDLPARAKAAILEDGAAILYALKCFGAAITSYYIALRIGLDNPFWAVTTVYITAQPFSGAVLAKSIFRVFGTILGATAAVALVPNLVNEPIILSASLAAWVGCCAYLAALDRTPRSYAMLLAGYTASTIGFPSVSTPGSIFDTAILRVQEITLGILCTSLFHGVVLPRPVTGALRKRCAAIVADIRRGSAASVRGVYDETLDQKRRHVASDLAELSNLSVQLPFDTARLIPRISVVRAFQHRSAVTVPLAVTVEDALAALSDLGGVPEEPARMIERLRLWLVTDPLDAVEADRLSAEMRAYETDREYPRWRAMLLLTALDHAAELLDAVSDIAELDRQIVSGWVEPVSMRVRDLSRAAPRRAAYRDQPRAARIGLGAFVTILLGSIFWIATAWSSGANAVLIMGVGCSLFGGAPNPKGTTIIFTLGSIVGIVLAALYGYAILPRVTDPIVYAVALAPGLLLIGSFQARPTTALPALGCALGFVNTVGFADVYQGNFANFANGSLATIAGTAFAAVILGIVQSIGQKSSLLQLQRAGIRDVARAAERRDADEDGFMTRMFDRIGVRLAMGPDRQSAGTGVVLDALTNLRIAHTAHELAVLGRAEDPDGAVRTTLVEISGYFRALDPRAPAPPPARLLDAIDRAADWFWRADDRPRRRHGLVVLTSLRRSLFPNATPFREIRSV